MDYEVVMLEEKTVAGIAARTNNGAPDMGAVIGGLWQTFYGEGICEAIPDKADGKALGIYTDYESNEKGDYTIMVACEVTDDSKLPENVSVRKIPAGKYAKFVVQGDMHKAVADFWGELWQTDLPRAFLYDFEEYQNSDMEQAVIHMYISLRD